MRRLRGGLWAAVFLMPIVLGCSGGKADPKDRTVAAARRGDWESVKTESTAWLRNAPADPQARLYSARAAFRTNAPHQAVLTFADAGAEELRAGDFVDVSSAFASLGRPRLAWLALEAARRMVPEDSAIRDRLREAGDRLRPLDGATKAVDHIAAVRGAQALGELTLGLGRLVVAKDEGADPALDRLTLFDRATLRGIDSADRSRNTLARLALELGRAKDAQAWIADRRQSRSDPEAHWLLSRIALQHGRPDEADAQLERSGGWGAAHASAFEPSPYSGSRSCAGCHRTIYRHQQRGHHARTIRGPNELGSVPLPKGPLPDPRKPGVTHRIERVDERVEVAAQTKDGTLRALVDYAIGSGRNGVTMLAKAPDGAHRELRMSYYSRGDHWDLTTGFDPHPRNSADLLGIPVAASGFRDCLHCHTTRYRATEAPTGPETVDHGIGCERCHGPAAGHLKAVSTGFAEPAITFGKNSPPQARMAQCAECHASDGSIPPTDVQFIRFQASTLPLSKCFRESAGKLDCVTCHDPHRDLETRSEVYDAKCLVCHGTQGRPDCPVNPKADCVRCHMPRTDDVLPFTPFHDHHIRVHPKRPPDATAAGER